MTEFAEITLDDLKGRVLSLIEHRDGEELLASMEGILEVVVDFSARVSDTLEERATSIFQKLDELESKTRDDTLILWEQILNQEE